MIKGILNFLPEIEKYDLKSQLFSSSKAIPRLIAEGFAKKHQAKGFQKYLDDALAEANETNVGLSQIRDLYKDMIDLDLCEWLIEVYDRIGKQIFMLKSSWYNLN